MVSVHNIGYSHDASVLVPRLGANVEDCHSQLMVEVSEAKLCPKILLGYLAEFVPSMGLTSNSWHMSLNLSLNLGSDFISSLYLLANSFKLL